MVRLPRRRRLVASPPHCYCASQYCRLSRSRWRPSSLYVFFCHIRIRLVRGLHYSDTEGREKGGKGRGINILLQLVPVQQISPEEDLGAAGESAHMARLVVAELVAAIEDHMC